MPAGEHKPPPTAVLAFGPALEVADVPSLCERFQVLVQDTGAAAVVCDVSEVSRPDLTTVQALARLRLTAGRLGCDLRLRGANHRLVELIALLGLGGVLPSTE